MKKYLAEPLVHFLLLGAGLFVLHAAINASDKSSPDNTIVVTEGRIDALITGFTRTWQRPPTPEELDGLIIEHVREELAAREARTIGLADDDSIIRKRLRQKLEFIAEDLAAQAEPTDAELLEWFQKHAERFREEPRLTFAQVFLNRERRGGKLEREAAALLAELSGSPDAGPAAGGDPTLLQPAFEDIALSEVDGLFGPGFGESIGALEPGLWHGPIESSYGAHLVRVEARIEGRMPTFDESRETLRAEILTERRVEARDRLYASLLKRYTVTIEDEREPS